MTKKALHWSVEVIVTVVKTIELSRSWYTNYSCISQFLPGNGVTTLTSTMMQSLCFQVELIRSETMYTVLNGSPMYDVYNAYETQFMTASSKALRQHFRDFHLNSFVNDAVFPSHVCVSFYDRLKPLYLFTQSDHVLSRYFLLFTAADGEELAKIQKVRVLRNNQREGTFSWCYHKSVMLVR